MKHIHFSELGEALVRNKNSPGYQVRRAQIAARIWAARNEYENKRHENGKPVLLVFSPPTGVSAPFDVLDYYVDNSGARALRCNWFASAFVITAFLEECNVHRMPLESQRRIVEKLRSMS